MCHLSEHDMLPIQPGGLHSGDEELRSVGVTPGIGHGQPAGSEVLQLEVLVLELVAIDGLSSSSITSSEVSSLAHEVGNHTVEGGALVAKSLLSSAQSTKVLSSLGDNIIPQLKFCKFKSFLSVVVTYFKYFSNLRNFYYNS